MIAQQEWVEPMRKGNREQLKIAMIGHKDFPSREGGIEVVVEELSERMVKRGHDVTLYNRGWKKGVPRVSSYKGVGICRALAPQKGGLSALVASITATIEACTRHYDVIHYHAEGSSIALILPHMMKIPTVVTIHALDWQRSKWGKSARLCLKCGEWIAAHFADEIIVLSEDVQTYFLECYHRKTVFVSNGISPVRCLKAREIKTRWGLQNNGYILFLARITPEKGLDYLIDAYQTLDTDKKLVVAGRLEDTPYCSRILEKAKANPNIMFTGFVQGDVLQELYSNCSLYVLPSEIEGMPLSLLEALSAGCRCLVSDIPENVNVARDYLYTFQNKNAADLACKISCILSQKENLERKKTVQKEINRKFDWKRVTDKTLAIYRSVIGENLDEKTKSRQTSRA